MQLTVLATPRVLSDSLLAVRNLEPARIEVPKGGNPSILDGALLGRLSEFWDEVEKMLWKGYLHGRQIADDVLAKLSDKLGILLESAGARLNQAQAWLQERLHEFGRTFIAGALALIPSVHEVGGIRFQLSTFTCTQKVSLSGNIKGSLTELLGLVCDGGVEVEATYTRSEVAET